MIDIKLIRENPELVKENMKKKFQEDKIHLVEEAKEEDERIRRNKAVNDIERNKVNEMSSKIGVFIRENNLEETEKLKIEVNKIKEELKTREAEEFNKDNKFNYNYMFKIPNIIDDTVPIGKDETENVELEQFGSKREFNFEIPYHTDIMEKFKGIDLDAARFISGNGFYYLMGDIARLHSAIISYARDFMIEKGFTYVIPPFMIKKHAVQGVMSFEEMDNMMYRIEDNTAEEGQKLYLIGTSEHSMIAKFYNQILKEETLPQTLTSYSPCFRKEVGAHGIEERGLFRVHQFEKQEMIAVCHPDESMDWYNKMWQYTVDFFLSLDIPVRTLECCSGDLADLKSKSVDVEAWSPRQQKYGFEVGSCSNLTSAQSRRLMIRVNGKEGKYFPHTLNNTVVAPPRMLIPFLENNYNEDGSITIPEVLRPYMGGLEKIEKKIKSC